MPLPPVDTAAPGWLAATLTAARPQALGALTRAFRQLDEAEEAYQEACLRALETWPRKGVPRDPVAWLIFVGRNAGIDELRKRRRSDELPPDSRVTGGRNAESHLVEALDNREYRDDALRLLFICCHPDLEATHQIPLALRIVCGLSVAEIARSFLVSRGAMEQRITRAKRRIRERSVPFSPPTAAQRAERLHAVSTMLYLLFNEGYSASSGELQTREPLAEEAIRLARLLLHLFPRAAEVMGLLALFLLQHARRRARHDGAGDIVLLEDQDRSQWDASLIAEGLVLVEKALLKGRPGRFQLQAAIAAVHCRAEKASDTDWPEIERLYAILEDLQPSPVVTLNRAVAVSKTRGADAALAMLEPLAAPLDGYFHFHGARGALLADLDRGEEARQAFERALSLASTSAIARHIRARLDRLAPLGAKKMR